MLAEAWYMNEPLKILYEDDWVIAIEKPISLPVHHSRGMAHDAPYVTKLVGQQYDESIYNVHRLDAKTSGVLLLARSSEIANKLTGQFANREVSKTYLAIVKGTPPAEGVFDLPVKKARKGKKAASITHFRLLESVATGWDHKGEENQELSLLQLMPETGRWHQLRQHCSQQRYDIIGDPEHGDYPLNRLVAESQGHKRLYLHASKLRFTHPISAEEIEVESSMPSSFEDLLNTFRA